MTIRERLHRLVDEIPEPLAAELERYAEYLSLAAERERWQRFALEALAARYAPEEVEYTAADARPRAPGIPERSSC